MGRAPARLLILTITSLLLTSGHALARDLTFDERVAAQEAIERVYYSHQLGTTKPFEEAVPRAILEEKVRTYLKESAALEKRWHTPIDSSSLKRELARMAASSRLPDRLREIYAALGNDSVRIQECVARPALVSRLAHSFFEADARIHAQSRSEAETLLQRLSSGELSLAQEESHRMVVDLPSDRTGAGPARPNPETFLPLRRHLRSIESQDRGSSRRDQADLATRGSEIATLTEEPRSFTIKAVMSKGREQTRWAVYRFPKMTWERWWELNRDSFDEQLVRTVAGALEALPTPSPQAVVRPQCSPGDTWINAALDDLPRGRVGHTAIWTGTVMIIWGGDIGIYEYTNTGGRYDPATDTWLPTSMDGAPEERYEHSAVWTGKEMIVWGGTHFVFSDYTFTQVLLSTGGRYDPVTDRWTPTSLVNAPDARGGHTAVWTGSEMLIWGGGNLTEAFKSGFGYDPAHDTWRPMSTLNAPAGRGGNAGIWTGRFMLIWGGYDSSGWLNSGGRYDPETDSWTAMSTIQAPEARYFPVAVWTGNVMIIWAGKTGSSYTLSTGGIYDPQSDSWVPMSTDHVPRFHDTYAGIWTGKKMLVWGGDVIYGTASGEAAAFDPGTNAWSSISTVNIPPTRGSASLIWTGSLMIMWGGRADQMFNTGGRYDPETDTWTPVSSTHAPQARTGHSGIWTGNRMVIWGGWDGSGIPLNDGAQYDPALDDWTPSSMIGAPSPRGIHSAVWSGEEMLIWGGQAFSGQTKNTGGRYDPSSNTWAAISTLNAPSARAGHKGIWTGTRMLIWGGPDNSGGQYDPRSDTWTATSRQNAPPVFYIGNSAVWTGKEMIVWSPDDYYLSVGGRYDPESDTWAPISLNNAPSHRSGYSVVWDGREMLVWGGEDSYGYLRSGGRYDPATDSWSRMNETGSPLGRIQHSAIWTGKEMIVWGGYRYPQNTSSGGRYDPASDTWQSIADKGAPDARTEHSAIWSGQSMIVWGGAGSDYSLKTGGQYHPYPMNEPPVIDAGPDQTAECASSSGALVSLLGTGVGCGDPARLSFVWSGPFAEGQGVAKGASPTVTLPLGVNRVSLQVTDETGQVATDEVMVTVEDHSPPVLICPASITTECSGPDGTPVSSSQASVADSCDPRPIVTNSFTSGGADSSGNYPLGTTMVDFDVVDASGNRASCSVPVTVRDTIPPSLNLATDSPLLWPPNHRMIPVTVRGSVSDVCDSAPTMVLTSVVSSEPDDTSGPGDGSTSGDILGADPGTADLSFELRAERDASGPGRTYTLTYATIDGSGNPSQAHAFVVVPHDLGGATEPLNLSVQEVLTGTRLSWNPVVGATAYKVIRGNVRSLQLAGDFIDLGAVRCVRSSSAQTSTSGQEDGEIPARGEAFFYLAAYNDGRDSGYGSASATKPRISTVGGCE